MSVKHLTSADFKHEAMGSGVALIDFWAAWCGPCRVIAPFVEELANEYAGRATVGKVDIDAQGALAADFGVMSIPTLIYFKDGREVDRIVGACPKEKLRAGLDKLLD